MRAAITDLLTREEKRPSGWTVRRRSATDREGALGVSRTRLVWVPLRALDCRSSGVTGRKRVIAPSGPVRIRIEPGCPTGRTGFAAGDHVMAIAM